MKLGIFLIVIALWSHASHGAAYPAVASQSAMMTREEALELAFPECQVERAVCYLKPEQKRMIAELCGGDFDANIVYAYQATKDSVLMGTAYFDTHRVRSLRETLMVVVDPQFRIRRVEVLAFAEPKDYIPGELWYGQFAGKKLDAELSLKRGIRSVTGATLTGTATTDCARRILAVHHVVCNETPKAPVAQGAIHRRNSPSR